MFVPIGFVTTGFDVILLMPPIDPSVNATVELPMYELKSGLGDKGIEPDNRPSEKI